MYHMNIRWVRRTQVDTAIRRHEYITRTGRYAKRPDKVRHIFSGCMPEWSGDVNAAAYWKAADSFANRVNARPLYTIECALPKALTVDAQNRLAIDFMNEVSRFWAPSETLGLPFTIAVHEGHGTNPHFHALLSTSLNDGIMRSAAQWFRRAHPRDPTAGGARRSRRLGTRAWLMEIRRLWSVTANKAMELANFKPVFDHRSHADRDIAKSPSMHVGPNRSNHPNTGGSRWAKFRDLTLSQIEEFCAWRRSEAVRKETDANKRLADQEEKDRRTLHRAMSSVFHELKRYRGDEIVAAATCALSSKTPDVFPAFEVLTELEGTNGAIARKLGTDWLLFRSGPHLWMWHPAKTGFIVIGDEFLATDSSVAEVLDAFAQVARLLGVPFSHGEVVAAMRPSIESRLAAQRIEVQWNERDVDAEAVPVRSRSPRP